MIDLECIVNGDRVSTEGRVEIKSVYGDVIATVPDVAFDKLSQARRGAKKSKEELNKLTYSEIGDIFRNAAKIYDDSFYDEMALARGNTIRQVKDSGESVKAMLKYFDKSAVIPQTKDFSVKSDVFYEPVGTVFVIPSSTSQEVAPWSILSSLIAGNPTIVKADSKEPFSAIKLANNLYTAGLPEGALSVLTWNTSEKPDYGSRMIDSSSKAVLFGSDEIVKKLAYSKAGPELSSSLPMPENVVAFGTGRARSVLFEPKNLEKAVEGIAHSVTYAPQECLKTQYVAVEESLVDEFVNAYIKHASGLKTGDLLDPKTEVGQTIPRNQDATKEAIESTENFMAERLMGEDVYSEPSLFYPVHEKSPMAREEIPAPSLGIVPVKTLDNAVDFLNKSVRHAQSKKALRVSVYTGNDEIYKQGLRDINAFSVIRNRPSIEMTGTEPHQGIYLWKELTQLKSGK